MLTRKHYIDLARRLREQQLTAPVLLMTLCDWLVLDNPRFDAARFRDAVLNGTPGPSVAYKAIKRLEQL